MCAKKSESLGSTALWLTLSFSPPPTSGHICVHFCLLSSSIFFYFCSQRRLDPKSREGANRLQGRASSDPLQVHNSLTRVLMRGSILLHPCYCPQVSGISVPVVSPPQSSSIGHHEEGKQSRAPGLYPFPFTTWHLLEMARWLHIGHYHWAPQKTFQPCQCHSLLPFFSASPKEDPVLRSFFVYNARSGLFYIPCVLGANPHPIFPDFSVPASGYTLHCLLISRASGGQDSVSHAFLDPWSLAQNLAHMLSTCFLE